MIYHQVCFVLFFVLVLFGNLPSFTSAKILTMSKFPQGIMMKCTKDGKLMKSIDDGFTWNEISVSLPASLAATSAVDAFFTSIASDATGENLIASSKNQGVFVSHDSGGSWQLVAGLDSSLSWMGVSSDAIGENLAALAPNGGIYFSNDHGRSWKESSSALKTNEWRSIVSDRTGQYLTATSENDGIFTSFDYGVNWVKAQTPAHVKKWNDITVDFSGQYLAAVAPSHGIYHSMDHGLTWVALSIGDTSSAQEWKSIASGRTGQFLAAVTAEGKIFVSGDYGNHWKHASNFPFHLPCDSINFDEDGKHLFTVSDHDLTTLVSSDNGITWSSRFGKLQESQLKNEEYGDKSLSKEAFSALFQGYKNYIPKLNVDESVKRDGSVAVKELYDNYKVFFDTLANSLAPSETPTESPTSQPSSEPTTSPSSEPSSFPSALPSAQPNAAPSAVPSAIPSSVPSAQPFSHPSALPSSQPSSLPTAQPSLLPTSVPSAQPTSVPSQKPSSQPSSRPSAQPIAVPTSQPSSEPTLATYATTISFNLTQIMTGVSKTQFDQTPPKNVTDFIFLTMTKNYLEVKEFVESVDKCEIKTVFPVDLNQSDVSQSIAIISFCSITINKWHNQTFGYAQVQKNYTTSAAEGKLTATLQALATFYNQVFLKNAEIVNAVFGPSDITGVKTSSPTSAPSNQPSSQPSALPTRVPSAQPTSNPTRDLTKPIPSIQLSVAARTSTSITAGITFTGELPFFSGSVFCQAFASGTTLTADNYISSIVLNGESATYLPASTNVNLTLSAIPITEYELYCVVQNIIGLYTPFTDVVESKIALTTLCCKQVSYATAPSFLFNYFSLYSLPANKGKNVFTVQLNYLPSNSLKITPTFTEGFANASSVKISPTSFNFTSSSKSLTASFSILFFNASLNVNDILELRLSGPSKPEFTTSQTFVQIVSQSNVPAPALLSAQMSNDASSLNISFDGNTNYGGLNAASSFPCSRFFSFSYYNGTTDPTTCLWISASIVSAKFPAGVLSLIYAGSLVGEEKNKVTVKARTIQAQCTAPPCINPPYTTSSTVKMLPPVRPASPNILLSVPALLAGCGDLTIDASGSTGNLGYSWMTVKYLISSPNVGVTSVNQLLATKNDTTSVTSAITIPNNMLSATNYFLTLTLTNVFGKLSSVTVPFAKSANTNIPSASIAGPSTIVMKAKSTLSLAAVGAVSPCGVANASLSYAWKVFNSSGNAVAVTSTSRTTSIFSLRSYALASGAIYTVTLTVTSSDGTAINTASASASVTVQVKLGDVVGKIAGSHTLLSSQDLTLDASGSYDENVAPGGSSSLSYQWSCASLDAATYGSDCTSEALAGSTLTNPTLFVNYTNLFPSRSYSFVVVASSGSRSGTDAVTVNTVSFSSKDAQIRASAAISSSLSTTTTVNQFQALSIQASISSSIKSKVAISKALVAQWIGFFSDETDTFDVQSVTSLRSVNATLNVTSRTPLVNYAFPLTIKASSFEAGSQVTFRLSLFSDGSAVSYSDITYNVVSNPSGGAFAVSPTAGVALSTLFSLRCFGWNDDASNLPLSYDFRYSWGSGLFTIQSSSLLNFASTALPAGTDNDLGGNITLISRVFNVYGGFQSISVPVKVLKTDSSSGGQSQAISNYLKNSLSSSTKSGNTEAIVATVSIVGNTLNSVNCTLATATRCASLNRKQCATTPQTCGSCLSGFSGIFGPSNTRCSARRNRGRRVLTASDSVQSAAETACATDDDCEFGTCNLQTGFCLVPPKDCVSNCNGNGVCAYSNINGQAMNRSDCAVDNTFCLATCSCSTGFYGIDCSLTQADYEQRESSRALMCSSLASVIQSSNPSSNLIDSMASALTAAYNSYEVLTEEGRDSCFQLIEGIVGLAQAGYLTVEQLPDTTGETTTATQNLWNSVSSFIKIGDTTSLNSIVTSFTDAVMSLLASGQSDVQFLSDNLKLSFNKIRFSDVIEQEFTIPQSDSESNYGTVTPTITFTSNDPNEIINSCSVFDSPDPTQLGTAINNANNYFTFAYGSWNANPFAQAGDYDTVVVRTQAYTNNTVTTKEVYDVPLYYISYPFTSSQEFQNFSRMSKEERSLYNQSFPVCSEYFWKNSNQDYLPSICSSCNVSTYDNTSVTFACFDMQSFCGAPNAREIDGTITSITSDRRQLASAGDNVNQFGAMVKSVGASAVGFSYNNFKIDVNAAIPILIAVGGIVLLILIGLVYFYQWDINDYYIVKYSNRIKYNYTSMIFDSSPVDATRAGQMLLETDDGKDDETIGGKKTTAYGSILKSVGFGDKFQSIIPGGDSKAVGTSSSDILYILHNAFPAVVYQSAEEGERGSLGRNRNSTATNATSKSFYEALTRNDYLNMFKSQNYYYHRFIKWVQVMIQVITILFINTLFFYIFYPDRGQCEDYKTEGDCLYHKNLITQNYLCQWSSDGVLVKDVTCELRPPQLSVPFIMLLSTVTIMIAMPLVIGWNVLFMDLCATIPPAWYQFLLGDNEPQQAVAVTSRGREHVEGEEGDEKEDEDAVVHAEESSNRYAVSRHAQRINRKPLPEGARKGTGGRGSSVMGEDERSGTVISSELFYVNRIPVEEEMDVLFQAIQRFYHQLDHQSSTSHHNYHGVLSPIQAKMLYIYYSLGIDSNFHTVPLSLRQQLKYGSLFASPNDHTVKYRNVAGEVAADMTIHHAAYQRIKNKLSQSRFESEEFVRFFANQAKNNTSSNDPVKERDVIMMNNIQLLQFFIFEQFPIYQKYLLYYFFHHTYLYSNLHLFNSLPSDMKASHNSVLNMIAWVFKSLVLLGGIAFSVYFILNWSIVSNDNTFASWGINYIIIVVEQLFIIQWIQHFYVQNIISSLLLPKLQVIYSMIYQKLVQLASVPAPRVGSVAFSKGLKSAWPSTYSLGLSSAWPGMSYYSTATGLKDDASTNLGDLGGWKDEFPVSQLLSPVARACKTTALTDNLVISRMVNSFTDADMVNLKSQLSDMSTQYIIESNNKSFWSRGRPLSGAGSVVEGREEAGNESGDVNSTYYKEVSEWKQYSFFHLLFIMLPLFIIQGMFQGLFSVLPFLSSSFYSKNFVLNSFHMVYFNMLFSYIVPGLISLLVIVAYYFCISVPLPAFIIVTLVVLFLVFYMTPKRNEQFWQSILSGYGSAAGHRQRRFATRGSGSSGFSISSLREFFFVYVPYGLGRVVGFILSPFVRTPSRSQFLADQQWQRQNIPMSLQSIVLAPDNTQVDSSSAPVYDSYLMSLLASQHQTATADGSKSLVPSEIQQITAVSTFQQKIQSDRRVPPDSPQTGAKESYLSSLLDQTYYDGKQYEDYLLSKFKVRKDEDLGKRISSANYTAASSRTDGGNDHVIVVDGSGTPIGVNDQTSQQLRRPPPYPLVLPGATEGEEGLDPRTVYVTTITSVRQLRYLTEHIMRTPGGVGAGAATNHRYYNLYHKATDDVQIAILRAITIHYLHGADASTDPNLLNNLNHIFTLSEQIFSQPLAETAVPASNATVDATECNEIMQQFFGFYVPILSSGATLSNTERTEIVNDFYQFIIINDYSWESISFPAFLQWFRLMMDKIVKYKTILQYGSGSSTSGNSQGSGNTGEKAPVEGGGSSNGSDDGKGSEGSGGSRGKYQYQMNYQRLQRAVMTDASNLPGMSESEDASVLSTTTLVVRPAHTTPQPAPATSFSTPRRVGQSTATPPTSASRPINVQTSANPDDFTETNPLRTKPGGKVTLDLTKQLSDADRK